MVRASLGADDFIERYRKATRFLSAEARMPLLPGQQQGGDLAALAVGDDDESDAGE